MKIKNNQIYSYALELSKTDMKNIKMPVRINFFLQKNIQLFTAAAQDIEQARINIIKQFGEPAEDGVNYTISPEKISIVNQEIEDLFNLEQELNFHIFKLAEFDGIELEYQQMSAIMFMIEE